MKKANVKTIILEENHELFYLWNKEIWDKRLNAKDNTLLHFDEHNDLCPPRVKTSIDEINSESDLMQFTYDELAINTFIIPSIYQGIFNKVYWVNHKNTNSRPIKRCVRTFNNEGKKFIVFNPSKKPLNTNAKIKKFMVLPVTIGTLKLNNHKNVFLDVSLNYFSCVSDPIEYRVSYIEIAKSEYEDFIANQRYHNLKFELLGHRISTKQENGKYYYVLNDHEEIYSSVSSRLKEDITKKINNFVTGLSRLNLIPSIITITRSVKSGYTPNDMAEYIESELINKLRRIYSLNISHIDSYIDKKESKLDVICTDGLNK